MDAGYRAGIKAAAYLSPFFPGIGITSRANPATVNLSPISLLLEGRRQACLLS